MKGFSNICDWFIVDNKPSRRQNEINFISKLNLKLAKEFDIRYKEIKIKQHNPANYLGWVLDEIVLVETMTLRINAKINFRLKFLY